LIDQPPGRTVAILGDSRILYDTDLARFELRPVQLAIAGSSALPFLEDLASAVRFNGLAIVDRSYSTEPASEARRWSVIASNLPPSAHRLCCTGVYRGYWRFSMTTTA
jgi:hypothetical protein